MPAGFCAFKIIENIHKRILQSTHHFLHSHQLASDKLHDDFMERCTLAQSLNPWSHGISLDLFLCLLPLYFCLGKFAILRLCLIIFLRQHLQFQDITMFGSVMGKVWQKKKVTIYNTTHGHYCLEYPISAYHQKYPL